MVKLLITSLALLFVITLFLVAYCSASNVREDTVKRVMRSDAVYKQHKVHAPEEYQAGRAEVSRQLTPKSHCLLGGVGHDLEDFSRFQNHQSKRKARGR